MFDDQQNTPGVPGNLPMEPVDMFAGTEKDVSMDETQPEAPQTPNALSAGLLKKKDASAMNMNTNTPPLSSGSMYEMKQPFLGKILLVIFLVVVLGGIGFGGWYFYDKFKTSKTVVVNQPVVQVNNVKQTTDEPASVQNNPVVTPTPSSSVSSTEVTASMNNDKILFGESVDSDHDGLDDVRENQLGTDAHKADTDGDGLTDGDEVIIWKTNPLNKDTDGDNYSDGSEVFHGYNPLGAGKLFNVPSSTNAFNASSSVGVVSSSSAVSAPVKSTSTKK